MVKYVKITLSVADQAQLAAALETTPGLSLDCGPPRQSEEGDFRVTVFGTETQAKKLAGVVKVVDVDRTFDAMLAERRAEVGQGDRFDGGKVKPTGHGRLVEP